MTPLYDSMPSWGYGFFQLLDESVDLRAFARRPEAEDVMPVVVENEGNERFFSAMRNNRTI